MGHRVVYAGSPDGPRTRRARELAPPDLDVGFVDPALPGEERLAALADCEVLILTGLELSVEQVDKMPSLKLVQLFSAGFDSIDVGAVKKMGVRVANNSAAIANSVAEHAILLMLMVYRRASQSIDGARDGSWQTRAKSGRHGRLYELRGKTVGIVGLGHIGAAVARRIRGFDTETIYHDVRDFPKIDAELGVRRVPLDELLERSNVVTVHVPLHAATNGLFGNSEFEKMRPDAIFINTCRGPVHDEAALIEALTSGQIAGAGLDVTEVKPTPAGSPLLTMDNVVVTPHIASSSQERVERAILFSFENARRALDGLEPESQVEVLR